YWDLRPSHRHPTLEYRVFDAVHTGEEAVVLAGLARALAVTGAAAGAAGTPAPDPPTPLVTAATFAAARHGLAGPLLDPLARGLRPAAEVVGQLLDLVRPALEAAGDRERVEAGVRVVLARCTGAARQRAAAARGGLEAAARLAVAETAEGL
ncbi:MAG TPA: hypothetical protein VNT51_02885, partial [Miltoncostaeaceae bacterium]|nr:hypothetical protein [Miltoncostaeaceae bacterium]